jgi:phosphoribosylanthranilate isomerase
VRSARPWAVDGVRGTEASPGVKDHDRVRAFVAAAKEALP